MVLQLADRSTRLPRELIEDVLVKVGDFICRVDFVVLETEVVVSPENEISVLLGRPFLATCNALINCRDDKMKLTFGNMAMEVNVFNLQKQPMGFDDMEYSTLHWVEDLACEELKFVHNYEIASCVSHFAWSMNLNLIHLHLMNNVMTHYMHPFLHLSPPSPSHPMSLYLVHPHPLLSS